MHQVIFFLTWNVAWTRFHKFENFDLICHKHQKKCPSYIKYFREETVEVLPLHTYTIIFRDICNKQNQVQIYIATCPTPNALLQITTFLKLNSLPLIGVPSFGYRYYSKWGISSRTNPYKEKGILQTKPQITAFTCEFFTPCKSIQFRVQILFEVGYFEQNTLLYGNCIQSKAQIYGASN